MSLVVYLAAAPGAGKTRRLLTEARRLQSTGKRVRLGWIATRGRADLDRLAEGLEPITFDAALAEKPDVVVLDDLAHDHRWQDALALKNAGLSVIGAFDIEQLDTDVPYSFLKSADSVVALDASPEHAPQRKRLLQTIDDLMMPVVSAATASTAVVFVPANLDAHQFIERSAPIAMALDLALAILPSNDADLTSIATAARKHDAVVFPSADLSRVDIETLRGSLIALPNDKLAAKFVNVPVGRDMFIADATQSFIGQAAHTTPLSGTLGDRMRVGYGKLTVYLAAATGAGKTYAMLERGAELKDQGIDAVVAFVDSEDREEARKLIGDLPEIAHRQMYMNGVTYTELDRAAVIERHPAVVLIDDLAHTNAPGSLASKRYLDVLAFLRAGINVHTTLNVQQLEALSDVVKRVTGRTPPETLPDGILPLADEVILVDASPETLRERGRDRVTDLETLAALRELAIRETLRAKTRERIEAPFQRLMISIVGRDDDLLLAKKAARVAARLEVDFAIAHVAEPRDPIDAAKVAEFEHFANVHNAEWIDERAIDAAEKVLEIARRRPETVVAVGGTHRRPRWPAKNAFARRLLDAGAKELIVLARPR